MIRFQSEQLTNRLGRQSCFRRWRGLLFFRWKDREMVHINTLDLEVYINEEAAREAASDLYAQAANAFRMQKQGANLTDDIAFSVNSRANS